MLENLKEKKLIKRYNYVDTDFFLILFAENEQISAV